MSVEAEWIASDAAWRDPAQVTANWPEATGPSAGLLRGSATGDRRDLLEQLEVTLLVSREYEHFLAALAVVGGRPETSYLPLPHPSGIAVAPELDCVYVASTRNPNQIVCLRPTNGSLERLDRPTDPRPGVLVPTSGCFLPGALYLHDLAFVGGELHATAVGENTVIRVLDDGRYRRVWWPRAIEREAGPDFGRNYLQLNSIAAGPDVRASFFSATTDRISSRRPGHRNLAVDGRGVIFSGATREPVVHGLTRPHSARFHGGRLWVDNSGYGEVGIADDGRFTPLAHLPGWTRGLAFHGGVAFVGASRVIPRFRRYAPGLDERRSRCGVFAIDVETGARLASITWPAGNQIFGIECLPSRIATGLPFRASRGQRAARTLFYGFQAGGDPSAPRQKGGSRS